MRELQTWGSKVPRREGKIEPDVVIWIIAVILGAVLSIMR